MNCGDLGTGTEDAEDLSIRSISVSPKAQLARGDTCTLTVHIDPATYNFFANISIIWDVPSNGSKKILERDSILVLKVPNIVISFDVKATAKINVTNKDTQSVTIDVVDLPAPRITWTNISEDTVYFQKYNSVTIQIGGYFQDSINEVGLALQRQDGSQEIDKQSTIAPPLDYNLNVATLLGKYRIAAYARASSATGYDTLYFEVKATDPLSKK
jgi:hypothetical protein